MSILVRLSLAYLENYKADHHQIYMHVASGRGSVLHWQRSEFRYVTYFRFEDDVMFSHNGL